MGAPGRFIGKAVGSVAEAVGLGPQAPAASAPPPPPPPVAAAQTTTATAATPPPAPPSVTDAGARVAAENKAKQEAQITQQKKRGRASTVRTGPEGVGATPLGVKTLVGS